MIDLSKGCNDPREVYCHCNHTDKNYGLIVSCHRRFKTMCPECSKRWRRRKVGQIHESIEAMKSPKFVTLTLLKRWGFDDSVGNLDRIWEFRRQVFIKLRKAGYHIRSWIGVVELPNHVHIVMDCPDYIPQPYLSEIWHTVTGTSFIVDIRHVYDKKRVSWYVTKYLTKGLNSERYNVDDLKGFHIVQSWGIVPLHKHGKSKCPVCGRRHPVEIITDEEFWHDLSRQFDE